MVATRESSTPDFDRAFRDGQVFRGTKGEVAVTVTPLGFVDLPTGVVDVVDPLFWSIDPEATWASPAPDAPPGAYRVERSDGDFPIAARIVFVDAPAVRWEPWEQSIGVESATLAFCDWSALVDLSALNDAGELLPSVEGLPASGGQLTLATRTAGAIRMVAWSTGADGAYRCFWGIGEDGRKVCALVDMVGLYEEEEVGASVSRADLARLGRVAAPRLAEAGVTLEVVRADDAAVVLRVGGYDNARGWELRLADGSRAYQGKRFHRDKGILELETPRGLPENAHLFVHIATRLVPMVAIDTR